MNPRGPSQLPPGMLRTFRRALRFFLEEVFLLETFFFFLLSGFFFLVGM